MSAGKVLGIIAFLSIAVGLVTLPQHFPNNLNLEIWAPFVVAVGVGSVGVVILLMFKGD